VPPTTNLTDIIALNAARVQERVARAAAKVNRDAKNITIVAVSKKFGPESVTGAIAAGLTNLGENRVQEALQKMDAVDPNKHLGVTWHLVGHLQSNKVRKVANSFSWVHSVDSVELLQRLENEAQLAGTQPNLLIQVALADEATKHGASIDQTRRILEAAKDCASVKVRGLMTLPPLSDNIETTKIFFRRLHQLRDQFVRDGISPMSLEELSMGMSQDLEVAVEEGATIIRVGTAIFGLRPR